MTQLLVSVRDIDEARLALDAGVGLLDVKEPRLGSLGAAEIGTIDAISKLALGRCLVSAALGELDGGAAERAARVPAGVAYAKIGLAGMNSYDDWESRWADALGRLPRETAAVAVAYADAEHAQSPSAGEIIEAAAGHGCAAALVDTFDKSCGGLLDHWSAAQIRQFVNRVQSHGILTVLAGSLDLHSLATAVACRPDYVAVRGAVCSGERTAALDASRLRAVVDLVRRSNDHAARFPSVR